MRTDLHPLCPNHQLPMQHRYLLLKWEVDVAVEPCYACGTTGCTYRYDMLHGYFNAGAAERVDRDMRYFQQCPIDSTAMYIAVIEALNSKRTWKCCQLKCGGSRVTEGNSHSAD